MLQTLMMGLSGLIFPNNCLLCQTFIPSYHNENTELSKNVCCLSCLETLVHNRPPFCQQCSRCLTNEEQSLCHSCLKTPYHFDRSWSACLYTPALRQLIHHFKYGHQTLLKEMFASLVLNFCQQYHIDLEEFDTIVPIPLYAARERERGFNQAALIAQIIGHTINKEILLKKLIRVRPTDYQSQIDSKNRFTNLRSAFRIQKNFSFKDQKVLLFDDLLTTGATLSEAALTLKQAGAQKVVALTLAIA